MKSWRKWRGVQWAAAALGGVLMARAAGAAVMFQYVSDKSSYQAVPGQVINVLVYLKETVTAPSTSVVTGDDGMYSGGLDLVQLTAGLPPSPSTITGVTYNTADFGSGGNQFKSVTPTDTYFFETLDNSFAHGVPLGNTGNGATASIPGQVYLGSFQITAGSTQGTTNFNLRRVQGATGNTLTNFGNDVDANNTSPAYTGVGSTVTPISVTVNVPEPATFGLLLGAGALGLVRRRRN